MSPPRSRRTREPTVIKVDWPAGPRYWEVVGADGVRAWVAYKLYAADWYLAQLDALFAELPAVDHQLGVEMAVDGVLQTLCSAVDAAAGGVIQAAELHSPPLQPTEPQDYDLRLAATRLRQSGRLKAARTIDGARIDTRATAPSGWLTQLQRVRNLAVRQTALVRHHDTGGEVDGQVHLEIPGLGTREVREYLRDMHGKVETFVELLLAEVDRLVPTGQMIATRSRSGAATAQLLEAAPGRRRRMC